MPSFLIETKLHFSSSFKFAVSRHIFPAKRMMLGLLYTSLLGRLSTAIRNVNNFVIEYAVDVLCVRERTQEPAAKSPIG